MPGFYSRCTKLALFFSIVFLGNCAIWADDIEIDLGGNSGSSAKSSQTSGKTAVGSGTQKSNAAESGQNSGSLSAEIKKIKISSRGKESLISIIGENLPNPSVAKVSSKKILLKFSKTRLRIPSAMKGNKVIKAVRSSDHSGEGWVVVDLNKPQFFNLEKTDSGYSFMLSPDSSFSSKTTDSSPETSEKPLEVAEKPGEKGLFSRLIDASLKTFDKGVKIVLTSDGPPKYTVRKLSQPVKLIMRFHNTKLEVAEKFRKIKSDETQLRKGGLVLLELRQIGPSFSPISEAIFTLVPGTIHQVDRDLNQIIITLTAPPALEKAVEKRGNLNQLVSLEIDSADLNAVLKTLAGEAGFDVDLVSGPLAGVVNEKFKDVPLKTALATLLAPGGFDYEVQGNTLRIGPQAALRTTKDMLPHITEILTPSGGMAPAQFDTLVRSILKKVNAVSSTVDATRNVLILNGTPSDIEDYKKTIRDLKLDEGSNGDLITRIVRLNYEKAGDIQGILKTYMTPIGMAQVNPDATKNDLIIRETASNMGVLLELIKELDKKPSQVLIESTIIEVDSEKDLNVGINWSANKNSGDPTFGGSFNNPPVNAQGFPGSFTFGTIKSGLNISANLQALETHKKGKIISRPRIATASGVPAEINTIENVVIATTTQTVGLGGVIQIVTTFTTLPLPIDLKVTPRITEDGRITTVVNASITSQTGPAQGAGAPPPTSIQTATTTTTTKNGETIVIGGLVRELSQDIVNGIPLLSSLPIIGTLFQEREKTNRKVELIIFITPTILED